MNIAKNMEAIFLAAAAHDRQQSPVEIAAGKLPAQPLEHPGTDAANGDRHGQRLALHAVVLVNHFVRQVGRAKTDDDAMHGGQALGIVAPLKSAVGKLDFHALGQHPAPQHADLLALRSRYRVEAQREAAIESGQDGRNIRVRFGRA